MLPKRMPIHASKRKGDTETVERSKESMEAVERETVKTKLMHRFFLKEGKKGLLLMLCHSLFHSSDCCAANHPQPTICYFRVVRILALFS